MSRKDLTGNIYGRITVIGFNGTTGTNAYWSCECACGNITSVTTSHLANGHTRSCGCLRGKDGNTSHGLYKHELYSVWQNMVYRCTNSNADIYKYYGGRGITICDRWRSNAKNFIDDMAPRPDPKLTLERIDNDKGYYKSNCKWATRQEQTDNRRTQAECRAELTRQQETSPCD